MILVLGGTCDAYDIACSLYNVRQDIILSTATEYGKILYSKNFLGKTICGKKDKGELLAFLKDNNIDIVVDATHPFAGNASKNAIDACNEQNIKYIRYERDNTKCSEYDISYCNSYDEAGRIAQSTGGRIFITTGSTNCEKIIDLISDKDKVIIRVLPQSDSIKKLENMGLNADNIIAMKGPFSYEMNLLMFSECSANCVILKDSGDIGGTMAKLEAAKKLGIKSIVINRPNIAYPIVCRSINEIITELV